MARSSTTIKPGEKRVRKPKGAIAKTTKQHKEFWNMILSKQSTRIEEELSKLEGKEFLDIILRMSEFIIPKLQRVEHKGEIEANGLTVIFAPKNDKGTDGK